MTRRPAGLLKATVSRQNKGNELLGGSQLTEEEGGIRTDRYLQVEEKRTAAW